jgi:hypothetical protein
VDATVPVNTSIYNRFSGRLTRVLMPLGAVLVLALLFYSVYINYALSSRVESLQRESAVIPAAFSLSPMMAAAPCLWSQG